MRRADAKLFVHESREYRSASWPAADRKMGEQGVGRRAGESIELVRSVFLVRGTRWSSKRAATERVRNGPF